MIELVVKPITFANLIAPPGRTNNTRLWDHNVSRHSNSRLMLVGRVRSKCVEQR